MSNSISSPSPPTFDDLQDAEIRVLYLEPDGSEEPLTGVLKRASVTPGTLRRTEETIASSEEESEDSDHISSSPSSRDKSFLRARSSVRYEAVSYAWESLEKSHSINIRNMGEISITTSLFDILRHFGYVDRPRRLWVDAVCIDQANVSERNHQVAKMADVFSASSRVLKRRLETTFVSFRELLGHP
jgi:hypothetical protein